ncbi:DUF255 domain-containing protein [Mucilaginibacter corticis]|uniref:DUF255 domain-containing protein n=1 Tax=Mucilaginibacter corticis TaxID=2597670 RepID=A0A556M9I5_9SPHI|nr:thioredoxin fold domain-containing protein [Mucilaginibacter corticis]TSJ36577.1 DUF255 domain-containing protein [Mucilaginibacter corticis]
MKKYLLIYFAALSLTASAQGINFEKNLAWKDVLLKAKTEHKYIFMDCYATWCAPCKWIANNIFPNDTVGKYFNDHFINVALQMDRTKNDDDFVKLWYNDSRSIGQQYSIQAYPTYLFFDWNGNAVHRFVGTPENAGSFIAIATNSFDPNKQYYTILKQLDAHKSDSVFLRELVLKTIRFDKNNAKLAVNAYFKTLTHPFEKNNLEFNSKIIVASDQEIFTFFFRNIKKINEILGNTYMAEGRIAYIIQNEDLMPYYAANNPGITWSDFEKKILEKYPQISTSVMTSLKDYYKSGAYEYLIRAKVDGLGKVNPDWNDLINKAAQKFPDISREDLENQTIIHKARYYKNRQMWPEFDASVIELGTYLNRPRFTKSFPYPFANDIAWDGVFLHSENINALKAVINWFKKAFVDRADFSKYVDVTIVDTYANLLYKAGNRDSAIQYEEIAYKAAQKNAEKHPDDLGDISAALNKMKKGEKTWPQPETSIQPTIKNK